jgi:hypothetical protein
VLYGASALGVTLAIVRKARMLVWTGVGVLFLLRRPHRLPRIRRLRLPRRARRRARGARPENGRARARESGSPARCSRRSHTSRRRPACCRACDALGIVQSRTTS